MTPLATLLWAGCVLFNTLGQLSFKAAAGGANHYNGLAHWRSMLAKKWIWLGLGSYVIEFFGWLAFLCLVPLSQAVLVSSINILTVMIGGRILFGEKLTQKRVTSTVLIAIGVVLVGWS